MFLTVAFASNSNTAQLGTVTDPNDWESPKATFWGDGNTLHLGLVGVSLVKSDGTAPLRCVHFIVFNYAPLSMCISFF